MFRKSILCTLVLMFSAIDAQGNIDITLKGTTFARLPDSSARHYTTQPDGTIRLGSSNNFFIQFYNGSGYTNIKELGNVTNADKMWNVWAKFTRTIYNAGSEAVYFNPNFRIRFDARGIGSFRTVHVDNVQISAK